MLGLPDSCRLTQHILSAAGDLDYCRCLEDDEGFITCKAWCTNAAKGLRYSGTGNNETSKYSSKFKICQIRKISFITPS